MEQPEKVLEPDYIKALSYFAEEDVPIDLLVTYDQLPVLIQLLNKVPNLRGVVDHLAKPPFMKGELDPWKDQINLVAQFPKLHCKLSGMVTEADEVWTTAYFVPYVHHIVEVFGTSRILYGGDWPVCLQAAGYEAIFQLLMNCLPKEWG